MIEVIGRGSFKDVQAKAKLVSSNCHTTRPGHRTPYGTPAATGPGTHTCAQRGAPLSTHPGHPEGRKCGTSQTVLPFIRTCEFYLNVFSSLECWYTLSFQCHLHFHTSVNPPVFSFWFRSFWLLLWPPISMFSHKYEFHRNRSLVCFRPRRMPGTEKTLKYLLNEQIHLMMVLVFINANESLSRNNFEYVWHPRILSCSKF